MKSSIFQRNTRQREVILEELRKLTSHPTAADLYKIVRQRLPRISMGTVYRNLEYMSQIGAIQKLVTSGKEARFDGDPDRHYHLRCNRCGLLADLRPQLAPAVTEELSEIDGWKILGRRLEFVGICPKCKASEEQKADEM